MNKAIGILIVGLGLIMIAIGVMGTQSQVLADLKAVNPKLRSTLGSTTVATGTGQAPNISTAAGRGTGTSTQSAPNTGAGGNQAVFAQ